MSEKIEIKSKIRNYDVNFVNAFDIPMRGHGEKSFFIIDEKVLRLYYRKIEPMLQKERVIVIEAEEFHKTFDYCQTVIEQLVDKNIRKDDTLVIVGGGIVQDIGAFIACILFRGIDWHFYPTTLLAQADSCIGSKSSLNLAKHKNLLGTFFPPSRVFIDVSFLETLAIEEIRSGIGEMLHFYVGDGNEIAYKLMDNYEMVLKNRKLLEEYIRTSLDIKKRMIEIDEFDKNERRIFNYGHTFGHAIESVSDFSVNHGQAVTLGMDMANYISVEYGYLNMETFQQMRELLVKNMPAFSLNEYQMDDFFRALSADKKNRDSNLGCILTGGPGSMLQIQIPLDDKLRGIVRKYFQNRCVGRDL